MDALQQSASELMPNLEEINDLRELTEHELLQVSGGDWHKGLGAFALAGGIGQATFGSTWGAVLVSAAVAHPVALTVMVGLSAFGGYQIGKDFF